MTTRALRRAPWACVLAAFIGSACSDKSPTSPSNSGSSELTQVTTKAWLLGYLANPHASAADEPAVLAGAGDIARCYPGSNFRAFQRPGPDHPAQLTANLLDDMPGATVMAVGDNAYEFGSPLDYWGCYQPTWGRHRSRTRPATGNHEYLTPGALGYFLYFGARAAPPLGYYSYDLGEWHVVVLNSTTQVYLCWPPEQDEIPPGFPVRPPPLVQDPASGRACLGDRVQQAWLTTDLAAHANQCTIAYFHHPRFSSGMHGNHYQMQLIWDILYANGVDVVVSGHDHMYERFAPQNPEAAPDDQWGIRQFTVGTGGAELYDADEPYEPNSEVVYDRSDGIFGVLALALGSGGYEWAFVAVDKTIKDSGSGSCHGRPGT